MVNRSRWLFVGDYFWIPETDLDGSTGVSPACVGRAFLPAYSTLSSGEAAHPNN
jgi:hypothetical protein